MASIEEAAFLKQISVSEIYGRINGSRIHATETSDGLLLVCLNALLKLKQPNCIDSE